MGTETILWLSTIEVASRLEVTTGRVRQLVQRGRLKPVTTSKGHMFKADDVEYYANTRTTGGMSKGVVTATGVKRGRRRRRYK